MMRYFVRVRDNPEADDYGMPKSLHRFDPAMGLAERWDMKTGRWVDNPNLIRFTGMGGDEDYAEVPPSRIERLVAEAFGDQVVKMALATPLTKQTPVSGSLRRMSPPPSNEPATD